MERPVATLEKRDPRKGASSSGAVRCRRKFLRFFPRGFQDPKYVDWEREYKWEAHQKWMDQLDRETYAGLLKAKDYDEIAARAVRLESRTNLLFSFEKMALRDAVKPAEGARAFATGLFEFVYGSGSDRHKFEAWIETVSELPRKQTRVLTWPVVTVFGFLALPGKHIFLKPNVTRAAAKEYGFEFEYKSRPSWEVYSSLLAFGETIRSDQRDMKPRDMIDIQSFIWVQGSDEYEE